MKKILIVVALLGVMDFAFADVIRVLKPSSYGVQFIEYKNMKLHMGFNHNSLKNNEYFMDSGIIFYKVKGKLYKTSLYEIEYDG